MLSTDKQHALREQLALISTEVYLLLRSNNECEKINRYNNVQQAIDAILQIASDRSHVIVSEKEYPVKSFSDH